MGHHDQAHSFLISQSLIYGIYKTVRAITQKCKKIHLDDEAKAALIAQHAKTVIRNIFSKVSTHVEHLVSQIYFTRSILYIITTNSSVSNELHLRKEDLLQEINSLMHEQIIKDVRIKIR